MLTALALLALAACTLAMLALAAKWLDFGFLGTIVWLDLAGNILSAAGSVAAAILGAASGND